MKPLLPKLIRFIVSEDGPTAVEYAVMIGLIVLACISGIAAIGQGANTAFSRTAASVADIAK